MNLQNLYDRTKDLNYIEVEKLGATLSAEFIMAYVNQTTDDDINTDPVSFIANTLKLSIGVPFDDKLKIVKGESSVIKRAVDYYLSKIKDLNPPKEHIKSSSSVAAGGFYRSFGVIKYADLSNILKIEYIKFATNLKHLIECLSELYQSDKSNKEKARQLYLDSGLDFSVNHLTTNIVATIIYPIFPTAFPLTNGYCSEGFKLVGLEKLQKNNSDPETYIQLAKQLDSIIFDELDLEGEDRHFGVIDKMFYICEMGYNLLDFDSPNTILYGAPGTGKTYEVSKKMAFLKEVDGTVIHKMQFHPSFTYEDFIEGIKPKGVSENGNIKFELVNGVFKQFCIEAKNNPDTDHYFVVDEINRANLSTVFGETLSLIEKDYRHDPDPQKDSTENLIQTQYSSLIEQLIQESESKEAKRKEESLVYKRDGNGKVAFGVPKNVYFIGMMNDVDKSIDTFDLALRRRFKWVRKDCDYEVINEIKFKNGVDGFDNIDEYVKCAEQLNKYISQELLLGSSYEFGHSFFMKMTTIASRKKISKSNLKTLFDAHLRPTLKEYLRAFYPETEIDGVNGKLASALSKFQSKLSDNKTNSDK